MTYTHTRAHIYYLHSTSCVNKNHIRTIASGLLDCFLCYNSRIFLVSLLKNRDLTKMECCSSVKIIHIHSTVVILFLVRQSSHNKEARVRTLKKSSIWRSNTWSLRACVRNCSTAPERNVSQAAIITLTLCCRSQ